jgi:hypothetical protein
LLKQAKEIRLVPTLHALTVDEPQDTDAADDTRFPPAGTPMNSLRCVPSIV